MLKKLIMPMAVLATMACYSGAAMADECMADGDCKDGMICSTMASPHVCKPPKAAGEACKRDAACASKKCEMADGKDAGVCK